MRIALLAPPWVPVPPPLYGGTELVIDRLARGFQDAGHEVILYTTRDSTCPVTTEWTLEHSEGNRIGATVPELAHILEAYARLDELDVDIIHDHTMFGPAYARAFPQRKVVTTIHGPLDGELAPIYARLGRHVALIAISHAQRRSAPEINVSRVIHHGIDAAEFPVGKGDGGYFLFLGRMAPEKGAHRATEAAFKAGVPLLMAAKMREEAEFEYFDKFVHPYLNHDIQYLGEVPHEQKLELLAGARGLLNPIRWNEPFGLVMIEALACGTPVLSFPEGAAREIVQDGLTGFLCHDVPDMADAIGRVERIDRTACRAAVEGYFSTERMVAEHLQLFEELTGSR
jgi:glycosyltransferase involved in cell wall biosynthesis